MIRRVFALLGGGAALLTFASCSTFDTDNAATVNGTDISVDDLNAVRDALQASPTSFQLGTDSFDPSGAAGGDLTRQALTLLMHNELLRQVLAEHEITLTDEQIDAAAADMDNSATPPAPAARDAVAFQDAANAALADIPAPDPATLEAVYRQRPAATGAICLVIYQAPTEAEADEVAAALRDGRPVTTSDPAATQDGCAIVTGLSQAFAPDDLAFFFDGKPGDVSRTFEPDPANGAAVWQVIQIQPWDEALEQFTSTLQQAPGQQELAAAIVTADVTVASEYGKWDPLGGNVVALSPGADGAA